MIFHLFVFNLNLNICNAQEHLTCLRTNDVLKPQPTVSTVSSKDRLENGDQSSSKVIPGQKETRVTQEFKIKLRSTHSEVKF